MTSIRAFDDEAPLAEALDRILAGGAPRQDDADLQALVAIARRIQASARYSEPDTAYRTTARRRLLAGMKRSTQRPRSHGRLHQVAVWAARAVAALTAVSVSGAAAVSASASALPGEPLYAVKQVSEAVAIQTASDDAARQQVLLGQADSRLDEATQLLARGREDEAVALTQQYGQKLSAATQLDTDPETVETRLRANETRLTRLIETAPPSARPGIETALRATQRGLARGRPAAADRPQAVADPTATSVSLTSTQVGPTPTVESRPGASDRGAEPHSAPVRRGPLEPNRPAEATSEPRRVEDAQGEDPASLPAQPIPADARPSHVAPPSSAAGQPAAPREKPQQNHSQSPGRGRP